jgi:hypothetical protein
MLKKDYTYTVIKTVTKTKTGGDNQNQKYTKINITNEKKSRGGSVNARSSNNLEETNEKLKKKT